MPRGSAPHTLYKHKRKRSWKGLLFLLKVIFFACVLCGIAGGVGYGLFFSGWTRISSIEVTGTEVLDAGDILRVVHDTTSAPIWGFIPQDSFLIFPQAAVSQALLNAFPRIFSASIERSSLKDVLIHVQEREIIGIWCPSSLREELSSKGERCAFFDKEGIIFDEAPSTTRGQLFWVLQDMRALQEKRFGDRVFEPNFMKFLAALRSSFTQLSVFNFSYSYSIIGSSEVRVQVAEQQGFSWEIYFSPAYDAAYQVNILRRVLEEEIGDKRPYIEYVDLRVKNKVFYKLQ